MRLLRLAQHLTFSYSSGDFLLGVRHVSPMHRILAVSLGGVIAGLSLYILRRMTGGSGAEVTGAIWHKQGRFEASPTIAKSIISIVIVGMGAAIGREAALKDTGATVAGKISDWTSLSLPTTAAARGLWGRSRNGSSLQRAFGRRTSSQSRFFWEPCP